MEKNFIIHFTATQKNQESSPLTTKNVRFPANLSSRNQRFNEVKAPLSTTRSTKKTLSTQIFPIHVPNTFFKPYKSYKKSYQRNATLIKAHKRL